MKNKKIIWPSVSFIVCTYNCKDYAKRCFTSIKEQEYPGKIEMIASDGGSTDGTIELLKKMKVTVLNNKAKLPEGKGRGKWLGYHKSSGEVVIFIDSDNKLMEKNWTKQMVLPLIMNEADFCVCRMAVVKTDKAINRYLSLIGTDPFVDYKSIDSLLALRKLKLEDRGDYWIYKITPKNFIITGGYYFTAKRKILDKIGGYTQDTDVVYNLAKNDLGRVGIPKNAHLHHLIIKDIKEFTRKKYWWAKVYFETQVHGRDFNWIESGKIGKLKLASRIFLNLLFIPKLFTGIKMAILDKEIAWLLHPLMTWLTTVAYVSAYIYVKVKKILKK